MADILCGYTADRDETLIAYLYGEIDEGQRAAFDAHVVTCERCRHELAELQGVRAHLREWTAPEPVRPLAMAAPFWSPAVPAAATTPWWRGIPVWAQVAAALLVLGVSAGIANLDVHYDRTGLTVRTGWSPPVASTPARATEGQPVVPAQARSGPGARPPEPVTTTTATTIPWQADLVALERRLRAEFHSSSSAGPALTVRDDRTANADAQLLRKVRALLDDSERTQRNEMALQIAEVVREFDTKRGSDLANYRTLKNVQNVTGVEIARQQQWLDVLTRASLQK
jgi:hypothetical protein